MWPFKNLADVLNYEQSDTDFGSVRESLIQYSNALARDGYTVRPFLDESLPIIQRLSPEHRKIAAALAEMGASVHEAPVQGDPLTRTKHMIWRALQRLDLTPTADFLDLIQEGHVVEIYSMDHRQLYRNFKFFEMTPLSLEEVVGFDWTQETERDLKLTLRAIQIAARLSLGLVKETIDLRLAFPTHRARWKGRTDVPRLEVSLKYGSPLFKKGKVVAFGLIHHCREIAGDSDALESYQEPARRMVLVPKSDENSGASNPAG
jgi:hypothetical protein